MHRWSHRRILKSSVWKDKAAISHWTQWFSPSSDIFFFFIAASYRVPRLSLFSWWLLKNLLQWEWNRERLTSTASRAAREERRMRTGFTKNTNYNEGLIPVWALSPVNKPQNISFATEIDHGSVQLSSLNTDCLGCRVKFMNGNKIQASRFISDVDMEYVWHSEPSVCQMPIATCTCTCANPSAFLVRHRELFFPQFSKKRFMAVWHTEPG